MKRIKIAVLVSGGGTNLQALIKAEQRGIIKNGRIVLVVSNNPDAYALERAENANIPTAVVSKKDFADAKAFEAKLLETLEAAGVEMIVLAGFMSILSSDFVGHYKDRIINVHPSLIPSFCGEGFYGLKVHEAALKYGVKVTGATVHYVNEVPDGGRIIFQKAVVIRRNDTPETLQRRVMEQAEWKLLPKACEVVARELLRSRARAAAPKA